MRIPLDEVVYFDITTHVAATGAVSDADSTPTFDVYEEATDTGLLGATNFTKRTSLTGNYRGTFTASAANGFEVGKWYSVIASATVSTIAAKFVVMNFMLVPAESSAGVPKTDVSHFNGTAGTFSSGRPEVNTSHWGGTAVGSTTVRADLINIAGAAVSTSTAQLGVNAVQAGGTAWGSGAITAASIAADAITAAKIANGAIDAATFAADVDAEILSYLVDDATRIDASALNTATGTTIPAILDDTANEIPMTLSTIASVVDAILDDTGTTIPAQIAALNNISTAQVNAEVDAALADINLDHLVKAAVDTDFATTVHVDSVVGQLAQTADGGYSRATDSLEAVRDRGDAAWTTATSVTVSDKTGFKLASDGLAQVTAWTVAITGNITGNLSGSVGSVTGDVGGKVLGGGSGTITGIGSWALGSSGATIATASALSVVGSDVLTNGSLLALMAGSGFDTSTDSLEAIRNRGDAAWTTATGFSTLTQADIRTAVGLASANLDTQLSTIDTVADAILDDTGTAGVVVASGSKTGYALSSTGLNAVLPAEPGAVPVWGTSSIVAWVAWVGAFHRNKLTQTATTAALRNDADNANIATSTTSDDGTTFTKGKYS